MHPTFLLEYIKYSFHKYLYRKIHNDIPNSEGTTNCNISLLIHYIVRICKLLYYRDLHLERWKSDDVVSQKNGEDEKITFLTIFS